MQRTQLIASVAGVAVALGMILVTSATVGLGDKTQSAPASLPADTVPLMTASMIPAPAAAATLAPSATTTLEDLTALSSVAGQTPADVTATTAPATPTLRERSTLPSSATPRIESRREHRERSFEIDDD